MKKKNLIKKVHFELAYHHNSNPRELLEKTRHFFYNYVLPQIDTALEKVPDGTQLNLDRLEIDLGKISPDGLKSFVGQHLERLLLQEMSSKNIGIGLEAPTPAKKREAVFASNQKAKSVADAFLFFLKTGRLPWSAAEGMELKDSIPESALLDIFRKKINLFLTNKKTSGTTDSPSFSSLSFQNDLMAILQNENCRYRLIENFSLLIHLEVILLASGFKQKEAELLKKTISVFRKQIPGDLYKKYIGRLMLELATTTTPIASVKSLLQKPELKKISAWKFKQHPAGNTTRTLRKVKSDENFNSAITKKAAATYKPTEFKKTDDIEVEHLKEAEAEGFHIQNAGLILLNPFLSFYFDTLGLLENGLFKNTDAQVSAAQLLHYAVNRSAKTPEHLMTFNKIICGIPLHIPIPARISVSKKIKSETASLFGAVLERWGALKNTTLAGFISTFLKREGILYKQDDGGWLLRVSWQSFDVLLDSLPWNINFVKLKWNDYPILTEWNTPA